MPIAPRRLRFAARRPGSGIALVLTLTLAASLALAGTATASPYQQGDHVLFTGLVTDTAGRPLPDVRVVLEVARSYISLRELRRTEKDVRRVSGLTNAQGEYTLDWPWDSYFNRFELLAGVNVRRGKDETLEVLEREDASKSVQAGSPVVSAIVVHNRAFVDRLRDFLASIQGADQKRVYQEMGTPDDVKRTNYTGRPQEDEVTWWYFDAGKVYRFRGGLLAQVDPFDPVKRF
jgi:hypothetical protein